MNMSLAAIGETIWVLGVVAWYVVRYPFERRAKRVRVVTNRRSFLDMFGLVAASLGMAVVPGFYVATGIPQAADYAARAWAIAIGAILFFTAVWLFRRTHKELGKNWSITLEIRDKHHLVSGGPYALVRHPMYTSFLLMALGQALLLSNWVVALAGLIGFALLFFLRVDKEERMMLDTFGTSYREYMDRTKRLIPYIY
ncbi:isoprenylcysteine carboxylmethyltransferase family protein [Rhizobium sp. ARZ01]|uniref:protein-S-isoprenylcysteine O-methyltransferase n=1 Tax=Rhizobium sp. ARZ01 TaxID=2769313 RepID=UPI001782A657|nr:protein-S-isoprenylcysteine O-methyltransferase [Rhizobium sp. ARZ01]MBD9372484.1 isoprenylcysteine carboxylmethyltransferase family protein [Rhizobium sp. ARZ01]